MTNSTLPADDQSDWKAFCAACQQEGIPLLVLTRNVPPADLSGLWTVDEARQFGAVPAGLEDDCLTVAMTNPRDTQTRAALKSRTGYHIFPVLARASELGAAIGRMTGYNDIPHT